MLTETDQTTIRTTAEALALLGVTGNTLNKNEKEALDRHGFVVLPNVIDERWLVELRQVYEELMEEKYGKVTDGGPKSAENYWTHEHGTRRLNDMVSQHPTFDGIYTNARLLAAVSEILGTEFVLDSMNAREPLSGMGAQSLHRDRSYTVGQPFDTVNSAWLLDDFRSENGATRFVPGSHRWEQAPGDLADPAAPHPQEVIPEAQAGSVLVFNAHVWHSGRLNRTSAPRRVIHCAFSHRRIGQRRDIQRDRIRKSTYDRISPAARCILDVY